MRLQATPIHLNEEQRAALKTIIGRRTESQQRVMRAKIILLAGDGKGVGETCRELKITKQCVRRWRKRWLEADGSGPVAAILADEPRSGAPARYSPEQVCAIIAIACESPEDSGLPITHWSQKAIAEEAVKREVADYVSERAVGHFLKGSRLKTSSTQRLAQRKAR